MNRLSTAVAIGLVLIMAGCGGERMATLADETQVSNAVGTAGITLTLRPGWMAAPRVVTNVTDPTERVAAAIGPAEVADPGDCHTEASERTFRPDGALVMVLEYTTAIGPSVETLPLRPTAFGPNAPKRVGTRLPPGGFECFDGPGWTFNFADHNRSLLAWVLLGRKATKTTETEALEVLSTLRVTDPPQP